MSEQYNKVKEDKSIKRLLVCYYTGVISKNPNGDMGIGAVVYDTLGHPLERNKHGEVQQEPNTLWKVLYEYNEFYPYSFSGFKTTTNNVAEYLAFIKVCEFLTESAPKDMQVYILGDSQFIRNQMLGYWSIKEGAYYECAIKAEKLYDNLPQKSKHIVWIPKELNSIAYELSRKR
jgi:ribonuclease HI